MTFRGKIRYNTRMDIYEHTREFSARYCDVDFKDELKMSSVLSYMEEAACSSADELGFGYAYCKPRNYAFMVTNIAVECFEPVPLGELVQVKTWPTPPTHVVFGREYRFFSKAGKPLLNASSRWCLVDGGTGKLLQSKVLTEQDYSTYNQSKALENVRWKIPTFAKEEGEEKFRLTIANSEYDHNDHVNNTRYADYCMNCFSVAELREKRVKSFAISYHKQCKEGERLAFYRKKTEEGYLVQGVNEREERVISAQIVLIEE